MVTSSGQSNSIAVCTYKKLSLVLKSCSLILRPSVRQLACVVDKSKGTTTKMSPWFGVILRKYYSWNNHCYVQCILWTCALQPSGQRPQKFNYFANTLQWYVRKYFDCENILSYGTCACILYNVCVSAHHSRCIAQIQCVGGAQFSWKWGICTDCWNNYLQCKCTCLFNGVGVSMTWCL